MVHLKKELAAHGITKLLYNIFCAFVIENRVVFVHSIGLRIFQQRYFFPTKLVIKGNILIHLTQKLFLQLNT